MSIDKPNQSSNLPLACVQLHVQHFIMQKAWDGPWMGTKNYIYVVRAGEMYI